jgi:hypothetical protein
VALLQRNAKCPNRGGIPVVPKAHTFVGILVLTTVAVLATSSFGQAQHRGGGAPSGGGRVVVGGFHGGTHGVYGIRSGYPHVILGNGYRRPFLGNYGGNYAYLGFYGGYYPNYGFYGNYYPYYGFYGTYYPYYLLYGIYPYYGNYSY